MVTPRKAQLCMLTDFMVHLPPAASTVVQWCAPHLMWEGGIMHGGVLVALAKSIAGILLCRWFMKIIITTIMIIAFTYFLAASHCI